MLWSVAMGVLVQAAGAAPVAAASAPVSDAPARATYGPVLPAPPRPKPARAAATAAAERCASRASAAASSGTAQDIIVCAPPGYRLNPDVIAARRGLHNGGPAKRPERFRNNDCASIGPMGCRGGATINLVNAAMVLGTMASKAVKGENVGRMFVTGRELTEYELYLEAKAAREAQEAAAKAAAAGKQQSATVGPNVAR